MIERIVRRDVLQRVLEFLGRSMDDLDRSSIARAQVMGFVNLHYWVEQQVEIHDLERQWNSIPL